MSDSLIENRPPAVSIILPTYNRARFLPAAFESIRSQTFTDWELIVVDDGSTDDTLEMVAKLSADIPQPIQYITQRNQGPYAARNAGIDAMRGQYVACFDSDDIWLPHHLADCVESLELNSDVDWVYGACRVVEYHTGRVLKEHNFYPDGQPRAFLRLRRRQSGRLWVIEDPDIVLLMIRHGLYCGPQNSVCRRRVFASLRFPPFNVGEDRLLVLLGLKTGYRFAYLDNVHVIYHVHDENSSSTNSNGALNKHLESSHSLINGYLWLRDRVNFTYRESRALNRVLAREYFWNLGYRLLMSKRRAEALEMFRAGLRLWPTNMFFWKTFLHTRWIGQNRFTDAESSDVSAL
jgi:glycosyltransferase involved in cell wall biosynthesis